MKALLLIVLGLPLTSLAQNASSASYRISASTIDRGGGVSSSASFRNDASVGGIGTLATNGNVMLQPGFPAQLNNPPLPAPSTIDRNQGFTLSISIAVLLQGQVDLEGDSILFGGLVSAASAQGGTIGSDGRWLFYQSPAGFAGTDSFRYTARDAAGDYTTNTVTITTSLNDPGQPRNIVAITIQSDGSKRVRFIGLGGQTYAIEWTDRIGNQWRPLATATPGPNGLFDYVDTTTEPARFYRAVAR